MADVNSSAAQDKKVAEKQRETECEEAFINSDFETLTCQCIFDFLQINTYNVKIPYAHAITWRHEKNRRNQPKFFDIIRAVCIYKAYQRKQVKDYVIATLEDFQRAKDIYGGTAKQNNTNLTSEETEVINYLIDKNLENEEFREQPSPQAAYRATVEDIAFVLHKKAARARQILVGMPHRGIHGLDAKIENFFSERESEKPYRNVFYFVGTHDFSVYEKFTDPISEETAEDLEEKFLKKYLSQEIKMPRPVSVLKDKAKQDALPDLNNLNSFKQALNTKCLNIKTISVDNISIFNKIVLNKNEKMRESVKKEENTVEISQYTTDTDTDIEGGISPKMFKSSVSKDSNEPTGNDSSFKQNVFNPVYTCLNGLKQETTTENGRMFVNTKTESNQKPTKKLDKEQNTIDMLEDEDPEDYGEVEGVFVFESGEDTKDFLENDNE
jgi:hypothetical protein